MDGGVQTIQSMEGSRMYGTSSALANSHSSQSYSLLRRNQTKLLLVWIFCVSLLLTSLSVSVVNANENQAGSVQLYFFTNHGCAPCRQVEPSIEALDREGYPVTTVYLSQQPEWGTHFKVNRTPTVILVKDKQIVGRHAGLIDGVTLKQWFQAVGVASGTAFENQKGGTKVGLTNSSKKAETFTGLPNAKSLPEFRNGPTTLKGTDKPKNAAEATALQATVRLQVEDPEGISYATGTVIHGHRGEYLVMTCGHVFRESAGKGEITAEFNFGSATTEKAKGELISYDAKARDIALVAIRTNHSFEPIKLAQKDKEVGKGTSIFSIGCDHGDSPTIRHSQIKRKAAYDGAIKYDIYGRPVDGRSGGGLFNEAGELIGVCNAAAVEFDEGIYTALETLHWQIAYVNLEHLFDGRTKIGGTQIAAANNRTAPTRNQFAANQSTPADRKQLGNQRPKTELIRRPDRIASTSRGIDGNGFSNHATKIRSGANGRTNQIRKDRSGITPVSWAREFDSNVSPSTKPTDMEVIILVRSKTNPAQTEAITVSDPSDKLLNYLDSMKSKPRQIDVAQLRKHFNRSHE